MNSQIARTLGFVISVSATCTVFGQTDFEWIPNPAGFTKFRPTGMSADGAIIVGHTPFHERSFTWKRIVGFTPLGLFEGGDFAKATCISADGSAVAGQGSRPPMAYDAFRWNALTGLQGVTSLSSADRYTTAGGISGDGNIIVGSASMATGGSRAFRWTPATGKVNLPNPAGGVSTSASGIADSGWPILGGGTISGDQVSLLWYENGTVVRFRDLVGSAFEGGPRNISHNGEFLVGQVANGKFWGPPFTWSQSQGIRQWSNGQQQALEVSNDGKVIIGYTSTSAFVGIEGIGILDLGTYLAGVGCPDVNGYELDEASAMTPDGMTICGYGGGPISLEQGWLAKIDFSRPVDPTSFTVSSGYHFQGDLDDIQYRDNAGISLFPNEETLNARLDVLGAAPITTGQELRFKFEGHVSRVGLAQTIQVRKMQGGSFVTLDGRPAPTENTFIDLPITQNVAQYIGIGGSVWARIIWQPINDEDPGQDGWLHYVDMARWTIKE